MLTKHWEDSEGSGLSCRNNSQNRPPKGAAALATDRKPQTLNTVSILIWCQKTTIIPLTLRTRHLSYDPCSKVGFSAPPSETLTSVATVIGKVQSAMATLPCRNISGKEEWNSLCHAAFQTLQMSTRSTLVPQDARESGEYELFLANLHQ